MNKLSQSSGERERDVHNAQCKCERKNQTCILSKTLEPKDHGKNNVYKLLGKKWQRVSKN